MHRRAEVAGKSAPSGSSSMDWTRRYAILALRRRQRRERNYANNRSALGDRGVLYCGGTDIAPGASMGLRWWRIWVPEGHEFIKFNREILVYPAACLPSSRMCMADHLPLSQASTSRFSAARRRCRSAREHSVRQCRWLVNVRLAPPIG